MTRRTLGSVLRIPPRLKNIDRLPLPSAAELRALLELTGSALLDGSMADHTDVVDPRPYVLGDVGKVWQVSETSPAVFEFILGDVPISSTILLHDGSVSMTGGLSMLVPAELDESLRLTDGGHTINRYTDNTTEWLEDNGGSGNAYGQALNSESYAENRPSAMRIDCGNGGVDGTDECLLYHRSYNKKLPDITAAGTSRWVFCTANRSTSNYSMSFGLAQTNDRTQFPTPAEHISIYADSTQTNLRLLYDNANVTPQDVDTLVARTVLEQAFTIWTFEFNGISLDIYNGTTLVLTIGAFNLPTGDGRFLSPFFWTERAGTNFRGWVMAYVYHQPVKAVMVQPR